jgi:PAS domain S-box-containing protein
MTFDTRNPQRLETIRTRFNVLQAFMNDLPEGELSIFSDALSTLGDSLEMLEVTEERLRASKKQLAESQRIAHVGSWEWDLQHDILTWSDELYRIYETQHGECGMSYDDFLLRVHPDDRTQVNHLINEARHSQAPFTFEHRIVRPDGTVRTVQARGQVIVDSEGRPIRMVGTGQDITEYREATQKIHKLNEELELRVMERTTQLEAANIELRHEIEERRGVEHALRESEQQFRQLAESIDQVFWLADLDDLRPVYVSPAFEKVFGLPRQVLFDDPAQFLNIIHPEDRERALRTLVKQPEGNFSDEFRIERPDGSTRWIWLRTFPTRKDGSEPRRFVGLLQDITNRKQTENALRAALDRTQELYQISRHIASVRTPADVLHALILSNYLRRINRAAIFLFDQPWLDRVPAASYALASWRGSADMLSIEGKSFPFDEYGFADLFVLDQPTYVQDIETDPHVNAKARAWYRQLKTRSVALFPLVAAGQWYGMLSLHSESPGQLNAEDLRHMRALADQAAVAIYNIRLLEAEAKARHEAEIANNIKMKFLAMISHELRTPLTSIKGFATTLLASDVTWDEASQREFITTINQEADKLTDMIDQLLDLSRLQAGTLRIKPALVSFADILNTASAQLKIVAQNHPTTFQVPTDLPPLFVDRQRIAQVVANLVGNAAKYSPPSAAITLSAQAEQQFIKISVHDEGPGINPEERESIFEPFQRGENAHRTTKGAGLGLAICKHLVEAHGGTIWIEDHAGTGTTMAFTLPIAKGD